MAGETTPSTESTADLLRRAADRYENQEAISYDGDGDAIDRVGEIDGALAGFVELARRAVGPTVAWLRTRAMFVETESARVGAPISDIYAVNVACAILGEQG